MKISLLAVGKLAPGPLRELLEMYAGRLVHYVPFEHVSIPDVKNVRALTSEQQKQAEGRALLDNIKPSDFVILLDERGRQYTSRELSEMLRRKANTLAGRLVIVVGGPYGFSKDVYGRADGLLSLSKMTFPHEVARMLIVEQLYRAMTIQRGEPYHHD
ncbi:MAG: 23S rRNA (pseudouridine(1915)-N(3))-methyltransferase RlmH [Muribaculaceae bacterium]